MSNHKLFDFYQNIKILLFPLLLRWLTAPWLNCLDCQLDWPSSVPQKVANNLFSPLKRAMVSEEVNSIKTSLYEKPMK